jgi:predicted amidophosphoribosyltransferase
MPDLLHRARRTPPQGSLGRDARARNVKGAIRLGKAVDFVKEKRILLVDDVLTTGATLSECVRSLREAGAVRVDVVTLARVVLSQ